MLKCFKCVRKAAWIVTDEVDSKVVATCTVHVALGLGRVNLVTAIGEDGPEMRVKKGQLDELAESKPR